MRDIWRFQEKKVKLIDRHNRKLIVTVELYERLIKIKGFVKIYLGVVYVWTARALKIAYVRLGKNVFMKVAGAMKLGIEAFRLAVMLAEGEIAR